jgi:hypothetical protein
VAASFIPWLLRNSLPDIAYSMLDILLAIFQWIGRIWDSLPKEKKEQIINAIVDSFEDLIRTYYRKWKTR